MVYSSRASACVLGEVGNIKLWFSWDLSFNSQSKTFLVSLPIKPFIAKCHIVKALLQMRYK